jgi:hypothetical protein
MNHNDDLKKEVDRYGVSKASRRLGFSFEAVKAKFSQAGMEQYVVAKKRHDKAWPEKYREAIKLARRKYDRGTHEMCQGRTGEFTVLYLIPRLVPVSARDYFRTMF